MLNLDTHMVVALLQGDLRPTEELFVLKEEWAISDIVLWELAKLVQLSRLEMDFEHAGFREFLKIVTIFPISREIAWHSTRLDFVSDPADEIIAATSLVEEIPLLTRDRRLLESRMVPLARV